MINVCILICGLCRTIDLIINNINNLFNTDIYKLNYYLSINNNNNNDYNELCNKILIIKDIYTNEFLNSLNYIYKFDNGLKIINSNYDLYIIIRSDLYLEEIPFLNTNTNKLDLDLIEDDIIYFSDKNINPITVNINNKLNESIIITKNYNNLKKLNNIYNYTLNNNNYLNIIFYDYLNKFNINYKIINLKYKLILSKCNIIAISGDSGSGKTTLTNVLKLLYNNNNNYLVLETDRYHKWERNDINYNTYTHLNPYSNYLEKMYYDLYHLKIGNNIFQIDYDHNTGKFTQKEKIESKENIILCGLHTLYNNEINKIIDLKIYMDTDPLLKQKWKIERDINKRGYDMNTIIEQINKRKEDYEKYILNQKNNADIIINFYEDEEKLECKIIIQNSNINNIIIKYLINKKYIIFFDKNDIIFNLMSNDYYKEIYNIIYYLYYNEN